MNLNEWRTTKDNKRWQKSQSFVTDEEAINAYYLAMESMATLNKDSAKLMRKYKAHGATDITGFGILGHA